MAKNHCCFGCTDRKIGCHSSCEQYISWQKEYAEVKEKERELRNERRQFGEMRAARFDAVARRVQRLA